MICHTIADLDFHQTMAAGDVLNVADYFRHLDRSPSKGGGLVRA